MNWVMTPINGVGSALSGQIFVPDSSTDPISVATALTYLRLKPNTTWVIEDSLANIQKNLDALQSVSAKITSLNTTDATQKLTVTAAQYSKDAAILAKWGAGQDNEVEVTGVSASNASALVGAKADYVTSITVNDSALHINQHLDDLQTIANSGVLRQIAHTGATANLKVTAAQLAADSDALAVIKNQAYSLSVSAASVAETLGLDGNTALTSNAKIKAIDVRDTTAAIEDNLDGLQRAGLRLKSISQSDSGSPITLTGAQYTQDALALRKIVTSYELAVIKAFASQASLLDSNQKVVTVSVADTAANISKKWALLERLADSLTAVEVTDSAKAISVSGDQLAMSESLLGKFTDDVDHTYKLAVTGVKAGQAADAAAVDNVATVSVSDSADNIANNFDDLLTLKTAGSLAGIAITGKGVTLSMDASRLTGAQAAGTQGVLDLISTAKYSVAATGAAMADLNELAANARVVSIVVGGTGDDIKDNLDTLYALGKRVSTIQQSDTGTAIEVTQAELESRTSVLSKIDGGFTMNVSGVSAKKAAADAARGSVAHVSVSDTAENIVANWDALVSLGATLSGVAATGSDALKVSIDQYLSGQHDQLLGKFDGDTTFAVSGASVADAATIGGDDAVETIDVTDDGSAVADALSALGDLVTDGKLHSITLNAQGTSLSLHASQLDDAQDVLDTVVGGRYTLNVDEVDAADAQSLVAGNAKIATVTVTGDAASIADNLADLTAVGHKLVSVTQSDAATTALTLTGAEFEQNRGTLGKISGGYRADLSDVSATKAAAYAASIYVKSLAVADSGANLALAWDTLGTLGSKLTDVAQSDSSALQLTMAQWNGAPSVAAAFSTDLAVSISGASVADVATLSADDAVTQIQVTDSASVIASALTDLAAEDKLTQIQISDPTTALTMSDTQYGAATDVLALVKDANYKVALSGVAIADAAARSADAHVNALDVTGTAADIASSFAALASNGKLGAITLDDEGGTMTLTGTQILSGADTLERVTNTFQLAATSVAMSDLADVTANQNVVSVAVSDTAENVSDNIDDLLSLGGSLTSVHLSDTTPVLALAYTDWASSAGTLGKIDGSYQVDLSEVAAADAATLDADASIKSIAVSDTASDVANRWSSLIDLYDAGAGKLTAITLSDAETLTLTADQQTAGADMITALLSDANIETIG